MNAKLPPILLAFAVGLLAAMPLACSSEGDGPGGSGGSGGDTPECTERADCPGGLACMDGSCAACAGDGDCARTEVCDPGTLSCNFREGWGEDCDAHAACALGLSCSQGLCMPSELTTPCGGRGQCPEGMRCNRALVVCEEDLGCAANRDCLEGEVCNVGTGACVRGCTEETEAEVCAGRQHCAGGKCVECEGDDECELGLSCNVAAGRCAGAETCFTDRDCPAGRVCNRATKSCTQPPPPCFHDNECLSDEYCDLRRQRCFLKACQGDQDSPNGSAEQATSIAQGLRANLVVCGTEEKWYSFPALRGDRVNVRIDSDLLAANGLSAQLRDGAGNVLASNPFLLDAVVGTDGTYYVLVRTSDERASYALDLMIAKGEPCDPDRFGVHDSLTRAAPLAPGSYTNLKACPGVPAYFVADVPSSRTIVAKLVHDPLAGGLLDLYVFDSDGLRMLAQDTSTLAEKNVRASGVAAGRAYFLVHSTDARVQNAYDLTIALE